MVEYDSLHDFRYEDLHPQPNLLDESTQWHDSAAIHHQNGHYLTVYQSQPHRDFDRTQFSYQFAANDVDFPSSPFAHNYLQPPYYSPPSTIYDRSSVSSDRPSPSIESPASTLLRTPELPSADLATAFIRHTSHTYDHTYALPVIEPCVTMQHVQKYADGPSEETSEDFSCYEPYEPQELIPATAHGHYDHPYPSTHPNQIPTASTDSDTIDVKIETDSAPTPNIRSRRAPRTRPTPSPSKSPNKITKTQPNRRTLPVHAKPPTHTPEPLRTFPCPLAPYGCPSTFSAKNEWKRHATTQHFRLGFWRCDQCSSSPASARPNDFNRKDLFVQHVRRMHSSKPGSSPTTDSKKSKQKNRPHSHAKANTNTNTVEATLNRAAERCHLRVREAPLRCCCVFCPETFEGEGGLEVRMEHVGKHMEEQRKLGYEPVDVGEWQDDVELESWMAQHGIVVKKSKKGGLVVPQRRD